MLLFRPSVESIIITRSTQFAPFAIFGIVDRFVVVDVVVGVVVGVVVVDVVETSQCPDSLFITGIDA